MIRYLFILLIIMSSCKPTQTELKINSKYDFDIDDVIFPMWIKDKESNIKKVNRAYIATILDYFGLEESDIIGTKGEKLMSNSDLQKLLDNDMIVLVNEDLFIAKEYLPGLGEGLSYKYPYYNDDKQIIGTIGIWIPKLNYQNYD